LEERDTILEYIFNRYGRDRVAFVAPMWNSNTARYSEWVSFWFTQRRTRCAGKPIQLHDTNSVVALVQKYGMMLEKYPNQRSMHSCGILLKSHYKLYRFRNASQRLSLALFDMHIAENIGFENLIS
jgi:DNA polymerase-3 subunit alpha/error-prone DNA polymerase